MEKISAVYKITNTVTGDFYIGSSKNVKKRWADHKCKSTWNKCLNNPMYLDMKEFGVDKFSFEILEEVEIASLKEAEQQFIEALQPAYNNRNANGFDIERYKKYQKNYRETDKSKEYQKQYQEQYENQLCYYSNETLTLQALRTRFWKQGIAHPVKEAKKYLIMNNR